MASRSHGVVTRAELLRAGMTPAEIRHRLSFGALFLEYRGIYRVGHRAPSMEARYLAAVWACGDEAVLSGLAAAHLWAVIKGPAPPPEVTAPTYRRVKGLAVHRGKRKATLWRGIPITTVPQTLVDLAATLSVDDLARACHEAGVRYGTTPAQVKELLRWQPGAAKLRAVMDGDAPVTLSRLEKRFLERLEDAGLPPPHHQPPRRHQARRLPLARAPAHGRARQLNLPQLPPQLGAGSAAGTGGAPKGRRVPALHPSGPERAGRDARGHHETYTGFEMIHVRRLP
ncbi:MAG: type IV toxin-antitoxin system AbiEi family antitoxin domain-containing protein [Solirubrobacteraceae bacterium]